MPNKSTLFVLEIIGALMLGGGIVGGFSYFLFGASLLALIIGTVTGAGAGLLIAVEGKK